MTDSPELNQLMYSAISDLSPCFYLSVPDFQCSRTKLLGSRMLVRIVI